MKSYAVKEFERVYEEESDAVFRFCLTRVSSRSQALDLTQETFLRFWQSLSAQKAIRNSKSFLFTIAHHLIIDWYRKKKNVSLENIMNQEEIEYALVDEKTINLLDLGTEGRYLLEKINELAENYRQPVYLHFIEDLSPKEIGDILGISPGAASVRVNRGITELRKKTGYDNNSKKI